MDVVSFEVMRERGLTTAFAFDPDFERARIRTLLDPVTGLRLRRRAFERAD